MYGYHNAFLVHFEMCTFHYISLSQFEFWENFLVHQFNVNPELDLSFQCSVHRDLHNERDHSLKGFPVLFR